ncbi:MAG: hypothetical protein H6566_28760 [Lewinellaceae bacterium]|nr:hypothetical protein [Lewinellaceae bacterium]
MADYILINGDQAIFQPTFGAATVAVRPGRIKGSGASNCQGQKVCVDGDEKSVEVPGCIYMTPQFPTPGAGTLKIGALAGNQKARKTKSGKKNVLLKGGTFQATFEVQTPAQNTSGPAPVSDPMTQYPGSGGFINTNTKFKGS